MKYLLILYGFCFSLLSAVANADSITVAVAANFMAPMKEIVSSFENTTGHQVKMSFASSGKIYTQIKNGAPFDLFLSADTAKPLALETQGLTVSDSRFTYAIGTLLLWSPEADVIRENNASVLSQTTFRHLAIANPKLAPYGQAAVETLQHLRLFQQFNDKLVQGENIAQTYQFLVSGNAELGFIASSQVMRAGKLCSGSGWRVPSNLHAEIRQDAVLLKHGQHNPAAIALIEYLKSASAVAIIHAYGYQL